MKYIIITIIAGVLFAGAAYATRYDWSLGEPGTIADFTDNDRFDWVLGEPANVDDFVAEEVGGTRRIMRVVGGGM